MKNPSKSWCARCYRGVLLMVWLCLFYVPSAWSSEVLVFAAASLKNALDEAIIAFQTEHSAVVKVSYSSSGTLARQIEQGAPADIFICANPVWMDYLQQHDLIDANSRIDLLGNRLVLIATNDNTQSIEITPGFDLADLLADNRLALGDPNHVPAGIYAQAALQNLGVWPELAPRLAQAVDVRAALALVARGEAPFGIVYRSDAQVEPAVRVMAEFPAESHPPIVYPAALTAGHDNATSVALLAFLQSSAASEIFQRYGFRVLH